MPKRKDEGRKLLDILEPFSESDVRVAARRFAGADDPEPTGTSDVDKIVEILGLFEADAVEQALSTLEVVWVPPRDRDCRCQWEEHAALDDPVLDYSLDTEMLTVTVKTKGKIKLFVGHKTMSHAITTSLQIDLHRVVEPPGAAAPTWVQVHDGSTVPNVKTYDCPDSTNEKFEIGVEHSAQIKIDAREATGSKVFVLIETYWKVEGCGQPFGGYRQFRRVGFDVLPGKPAVPAKPPPKLPAMPNPRYQVGGVANQTDAAWKDTAPAPNAP